MTKEEFEQFVIEALEDIPEFFKEKLENISIIIEDYPSSDIQQSASGGLKQNPYGILGVYQGIPYKKRSVWYRNVLPDKIIIFKKPIENIVKSIRRSESEATQEIKELIRKVVLHEIGHYYGLSEQELRKAGV